ncbi:uncharacterized protein LOC110108506 [Dendrobium catenatum]|uniref:Uncharacterized protein n=1 Tax=Dendrobium catenatum TaxID=906689 RepID=A0A2I0X4X3_9ASPA|nr:uncharacterized protein LOC110108506 [Dendrobium catenatum]PKU82974.1 hypothetical protein MA16_Dca009446 [Dendrobium catenatum]
MIHLTGIGRSGDRCHHPPPPPPPSSSSSTLSPLAPPFTVDRWVSAAAIPNSLPPPPPPPTVAKSPYIVPTGDSVWSSSSSGASRLTNLNSGLGAGEATRYYPYYTPARDSVDGTLENLSSYKGYVGGWSGTFDLEEGRPARGSVVNSSWMDSLASCQMSSALMKRGIVDSLSAYEDSFGSWHGAHNESSSNLGHVGSEWLDESHQQIYVDKSRVPNGGSFAAKLDATVWPNEGSSYFYSPETTSVVKECDTFIPSSYDRYISELDSCSRDPVVHYPAQTSLGQGYAPSNERDESVSSYILENGNSTIKHANLHRKNDDHSDYVIGMQSEANTYENAEVNEGLGKMGISGDAMQRNRRTPETSLLIKGFPSGNISALGQSIDCSKDVKFGFKVAKLSCCNASNSERGAFIPDGSMQASQEMPDHLNVAVDSPCWKGASVSRQYPFSSDEVLQPLVISVATGSNDLVLDQGSLRFQSDIEQDGTFACNENGKDIDMSPVTDLSGLDLKFQDCSERESNTAEVENAKEIEQLDIHAERIGVLNEQVSIPRGIGDHVKQISQKENIICKASTNAIETIPAVQNTDFTVNHISTSPNCSSSSSTNASNNETNLPSLNASFSAERPVSLDAPTKCLSQGQDAGVLVKAMLSLSEVLLCHYCNDDKVLEECDLKPVQQIIDNLEAVRQNKKGITGSSSSRVPIVEKTQPEFKETNGEMSSHEDSKDGKENKNATSSGLNNDNHDNVMESFSTHLKVSDGMAQEEDSKILLYKNLWVQTEATLCSLKYDVALMKLELESFKHHFKAKSQVLSDGLAEPILEDLNCATSVYVENPSRSNNTQVGKKETNHKQSTSKEDEIDTSVSARFRILKGRDEVVLSGPEETQEQNALKSHVDMEKVGEMNMADVDTIEKGVLKSHYASKFTVESPKKNLMGEKLPALDHSRMGRSGLFLNNAKSAGGVQESHLSSSEGSIIQSYNPKSHGKWLFSSGSGSPSSEWEHVLKDEFIW